MEVVRKALDRIQILDKVKDSTENQLSELLLTWSRDGHGNKQNLLGDNSLVEPPDPIPNSEVKRKRADGSVGSPHVRVGHRQAPNYLIEM